MWLGVISGFLLIASTVSALLGYRKFSQNFDEKQTQVAIENVMDRMRDTEFGPPSDFGSINMAWYRDEADRTVRRIYEAVGDALPDSYAYCTIIFAGLAAVLGLVAVFISN
jgi:hypothetical protein